MYFSTAKGHDDLFGWVIDSTQKFHNNFYRLPPPLLRVSTTPQPLFREVPIFSFVMHHFYLTRLSLSTFNGGRDDCDQSAWRNRRR